MSDTIIQRDRYKGVDSIVIENDTVRAVILPGRGAKIASLALKRPDLPATESLWQIPEEKYGYQPRYGDVFGGEDGSGYDDMFPSISPYTPKEGPWEGIPFPDHGEVWSIPWECSVLDGGLICSVHGIRIPCRISRTLTLEERTLRLTYTLQNCCGFPLSFQWAAHAIFRVSRGSTLLVPEGMDEIINAFDGRRLQKAGKRYRFPRFAGPSGGDLRIIPGPEVRDCQKYWFAGPVPEGWCGIRNPDTGLETTVSFDPGKTPYLGIWVNAGGWNDSFNIGIEPSSSIMDDPEAAKAFKGESSLEARETREWEIRLELNSYL